MSSLNQIIKNVKSSQLLQQKEFFSGNDSPIHGLPENVIIFARKPFSSHVATSLHHRFVLILCLNGHFEIMVDNKKLSLSSGSGILILPFQPHYYTSKPSEDVLLLYITFELSNLGELKVFQGIAFKIPELTAEILQNMLSFIKTAKGNNTSETIMLPHFTGLLLASLIYEKNLNTITIQKSKNSNDLINKVSQYVMDNLDKKIIIAEVAKKLGTSESSLRRNFRSVTHGLSLGKFIINLRLFKAMELLSSTNLSVSEVADKVGFSSLSYFSRAMKQYTQSPLEFRKKYSRFKPQ